MDSLNNSICQAIDEGDSIELARIGSEYSREQLDDCFELYFQDRYNTYFRRIIRVVHDIGEDKGIELLLTLVAIYTNKNIDLCGECWYPPVVFAVSLGYSKIVEKMIELGSNCLNIHHFFGDTLYHVASSSENGSACVSTIKTLFKLGCANIDVLNCRNSPPLFTTPNLDAAELFIQFGSKMIDYQDVSGCTMLHIRSDVRMIKLLVRYGATVDILNKYGRTPFANQCSLDRSLATDMLLALNYTVEDRQLCQSKYGSCLDEQQVLDIRYDVYFSWSLVARLLGKIEHQTV